MNSVNASGCFEYGPVTVRMRTGLAAIRSILTTVSAGWLGAADCGAGIASLDAPVELVCGKALAMSSAMSQLRLVGCIGCGEMRMESVILTKMHGGIFKSILK
jgi:hypothetical protein